MSGTRTPEGRVKDAVKKLIAKHNASRASQIYSHWPVQAGYGEPTLDCVGSIKDQTDKGRSFAIETKAPGEKPTPRQMLTIEKMLRGGVTVFIIGMIAFDDPKYPYSEMESLDSWLSEQ